mmetsp:Transcript_20695/g.31429  ORF Transcript_20695/g.31429 Transcript_20695/m.31429 type:complete len:261 (+) Transcript_20695:2357-3139(+)
MALWESVLEVQVQVQHPSCPMVLESEVYHPNPSQNRAEELDCTPSNSNPSRIKPAFTAESLVQPQPVEPRAMMAPMQEVTVVPMQPQMRVLKEPTLPILQRVCHLACTECHSTTLPSFTDSNRTRWVSLLPMGMALPVSMEVYKQDMDSSRSWAKVQDMDISNRTRNRSSIRLSSTNNTMVEIPIRVDTIRIVVEEEEDTVDATITTTSITTNINTRINTTPRITVGTVDMQASPTIWDTMITSTNVEEDTVPLPPWIHT